LLEPTDFLFIGSIIDVVLVVENWYKPARNLDCYLTFLLGAAIDGFNTPTEEYTSNLHEYSTRFHSKGLSEGCIDDRIGYGWDTEYGV